MARDFVPLALIQHGISSPGLPTRKSYLANRPNALSHVRPLPRTGVFAYFYLHRTPQLVALGPSPIKTYISTGIYYLTYYLSLHHIWFCIYRLHSDADAGSDSDLENASPTSRQCWTETVKRMTSVWTLIITVSSTVVIM